VGHHLARKDERGIKNDIIESLDLKTVLDRNIEDLSGGELQRFAIAMVCVQTATMYALFDVDIYLRTLNAIIFCCSYMFDEPSSYLDVKQRLKAAQTIRDLVSHDKYVIVVEHDLSVLDYLSDYICCLYGIPGCYGVVTMPFSVREGLLVLSR
jgi:ATP-binding cassette, sub-family E, member 1